MTPIISAISAGYGEEEILKYITKAIPGIASKIQKARSTGYSASNILKFLSKAMQGEEYDPSLSESEARGMQRRKQDAISKGLVKTAASAIATPAVLGAITSSKPVQDILGKLGGKKDIGPSPMSNAPVQLNTASLPQSNTAPQPAAQPTQSTTQPQPSSDPQQTASLIDQLGIGSQIQTMKQAGNSPEAIASAIGVIMKPHQRKWLDEQIKAGKSKSLPDLISDYSSQLDANATGQPGIATGQNQPFNEKISPEIAESAQKQPDFEEKTKLKPQKGELVATPNGEVGEIKSERNGKALIDVNGKLHQVNREEVVASPLPQKDLAELHEDLIRGIERETGEEVSRNVNYAGYNPVTNRLLYIPHGGGAYIYGQISPEDKEALTSVLGRRKTTGENFIGAWFEGTKSPIGAQMSALIKRLQQERGGKGNEYEEKFDTIYSAIEPAIKAVKKKEREKKKNERKR